MNVKNIVLCIGMLQTIMIVPADSKSIPADIGGISAMIAEGGLYNTWDRDDIKKRFDDIAAKIKRLGAEALSPDELTFAMTPLVNSAFDPWEILSDPYQFSSGRVCNVRFGNSGFVNRNSIPILIAAHKNIVFAKSDLEKCSEFLAGSSESLECKCKGKKAIEFTSLCKAFRYRLSKDENDYFTLERSYQLDPSKLVSNQQK